MKKVLCLCMAMVMLMMLSTTVLAHGGYGRHHRQAAPQTEYAPCVTEGCEVVRPHLHDGSWYCGQAGGYQPCTFEDCSATQLHEHSGTFYHCRTDISSSTSTVSGRGCCRQ